MGPYEEKKKKNIIIFIISIRVYIICFKVPRKCHFKLCFPGFTLWEGEVTKKKPT